MRLASSNLRARGWTHLVLSRCAIQDLVFVLQRQEGDCERQRVVRLDEEEFQQRVFAAVRKVA